MNCVDYTYTLNILPDATLHGATLDTDTITCVNGYTFGGLTSTEYQKTFTCTGTGHATNAWAPDVLTNTCQGTLSVVL